MKYKYIVFNKDGETIASGGCDSHTADTARTLVDRASGKAVEITNVQEDCQEPNCWSYDVFTDQGWFGVVIK